MPRYLVEQTFPNRLRLSLDSEGARLCLSVVGNNALDGVTWIQSYVTPDRRRAFYLCDAPTPEAIRRAPGPAYCRLRYGSPAPLARLAGAGLLVSLMNPFAIAFWMTVGSTAVDSAPSWLAGFMFGSLAASLLTGLVAGRLQGQRYGRWLTAGCGCLLIAFGLRLSWAMVALF